MAFRKSTRCGSSACVEVDVPEFRKASASLSNGTCVEVEKSDVIRVRDGKDPGGPILEFTPEEWGAFIAGAKAGEFDIAVA